MGFQPPTAAPGPLSGQIPGDRRFSLCLAAAHGLLLLSWLRAQGHDIFIPWFVGLSTVVYSLGIIWVLGAAVFWVAPPPLSGAAAVDLQRWRIWTERGLHSPPQPRRLAPLPVFSERFPVPFLDSGDRTWVGSVPPGARIWVGSVSCLSPIGNPFALVGRLTQSWNHVGDPFALVGRMTQFRCHVGDRFWANLARIYIYMGWPLRLLNYRPLFCRDTPAQSPFYYVDACLDHSSLGLLNQPFDWNFLFRAKCFYFGFLFYLGTLFILHVHGLLIWRLLTAWSMQDDFSTAFLFLALQPLSDSCRYFPPFLPRATPPLAPWRPLLHGLCPYLSRWFPCSNHLSLSSRLQPMASELIQSMENLQFTEEESESVVVESTCEAGDSGL
ncbi:hypothetical protein V6N11_025434 [Hibiscus sabdariffa]|uniref:Uncharacterized protein n=1 Tax=Hibiscus sabdariffa TaxID=183260 RepID=A0ABR2N9U2_9ROSI